MRNEDAYKQGQRNQWSSQYSKMSPEEKAQYNRHFSAGAGDTRIKKWHNEWNAEIDRVFNPRNNSQDPRPIHWSEYNSKTTSENFNFPQAPSVPFSEAMKMVLLILFLLAYGVGCVLFIT